MAPQTAAPQMAPQTAAPQMAPQTAAPIPATNIVPNENIETGGPVPDAPLTDESIEKGTKNFSLPININPANQGIASNISEIEDAVTEVPSDIPAIETSISYAGLTMVGNFKSTFYGGFRTILAFLAQGMDSQSSLRIVKGKLVLEKGQGIISCDLSKLFQDNDFAITNPMKSVKAMKGIKGGDSVCFFKDDINKEYSIVKLVGGKGVTKLKIDMFDDDEVKMTQIPEIGTKIFEAEIKVETAANLINMKKSLEMNNFIITIDSDTNELVSIETGGFSEMFKDLELVKNKKQYKTFNPFPVDKAENIIFRIFKKYVEGVGEQIYIQTSSDVALTTLVYVELAMETLDLESEISDNISIM